jgi:hypothetical protein
MFEKRVLKRIDLRELKLFDGEKNCIMKSAMILYSNKCYYDEQIKADELAWEVQNFGWKAEGKRQRLKIRTDGGLL